MEHLTQVVLGLVKDIGVIGYWVAFFAAVAETVLLVGLVVPGSSFLLLMGALAGQGVLDLGDLLAFAIAGAVVGDNVNYRLGKSYGYRWLQQERRFLNAEYMAKAQSFFDRHGGKSVCLGRFVPTAKELMPFVAGVAQMKRLPFFFWNLLGAIGWALQWILPGYIFSQSLSLAHAWLSRIGLVLFLLVTLIALAYFLRWLVLGFGRSGLKLASSVARSVGGAIRDNPDVASWSAQHPRLMAFLRQRVDRSQMRGLPTTLAGFSMVYVLLLFGGMVKDLLTHEAVVASDARVIGLIADFRTPLLNDLFYAITTMATPWVVVTGLLVGLCMIYRMGLPRFVMPMVASSTFTTTLVYLSNYAFQRSRPEHALYDPGGYSFPSGHAALSIAFYGFLFFIGGYVSGNWRRRINLLFGAAILALLIGFSRLYLGTNFLSDVLAGYLLGTAGLALGIAMTYGDWYRFHLPQQSAAITSGKGTIALIVALLVWSGAVLTLNLHGPALHSTPQSVPQAEYYKGPDSLFSSEVPPYVVSVAGVRKSPINIVFIAEPKALAFCLTAAQWHPVDEAQLSSVLGAYKDVLLHRGNSSAPLSPRFWHDNPPTQQWSKPDTPDTVFDRSFLRIWRVSFLTKGGQTVNVGSVGHETLPAWHLVPRPDTSFKTVQARLVEALRQAGCVQQVETIDFNPIDEQFHQGLIYEGGISVIHLTARPRKTAGTDTSDSAL